MTVNAAPAVSHEDGVQNSPFVAGLARRIPAPLGAALVGVVSVLLALFWLYTLVVTWINHSDLSTPFFQTTVVVAVVIGVAAYARKTLAWLPVLVVGAAWAILSIVPFLPVVMVIVQAAVVAIFVATAVFAVVSAEQAEKPRW
ncbi:MAG: hypothetical protein FWD85_03175 [Microbacteriaceae bacterium]|nr:hypothetical protein [Microbacteriaceae bacterium]MCL2794292.1 hypothetical protein [Microbacteriaceae bacterium]